jgi:hypothetical protein
MGIEQCTSFCLICLLCEDQRVKIVGRAVYIPLREVEINARIVLERGPNVSVFGIVCASAKQQTAENPQDKNGQPTTFKTNLPSLDFL